MIDLKKIYISYCDINWIWLKKNKINFNQNYVFCYKGYHPFTTDNNNYAFCKVKNNEIIKIKEKDSFTNDWQKEPLSIGLFYFKNGYNLVNANNLVINKNIKVNNEYFPSLSFNFIKNKKIQLVKSFSHVGTPEYYEIFKKWNDYHLIKKDF